MDKKIKEMICIVCPVGCRLRVDYSDIDDIKIEGNQCKRGIKYAMDEIIDPRRIVTSSVMVKDGSMPLVSVKTSEPIKKEYIEQALKEIKAKTVEAPVRIGDVIIVDIAGSSIDLIATRNIY